MQYKGRIIMLLVAVFSIVGWGIYDYYNGTFDLTEKLWKCIYIIFAWWAGEQYDKVSYLRKKVQGKQEEITETFERMPSAFLSLDKNWRFTFINKQAEIWLARGSDELIGKEIWDEYPEAIDTKFYSSYQKAVTEQTTVQFEEYYQPLNTWFEVRAFPSNGGLSIYFHDISDRKKWQHKVNKLAYHDILTGLPNRYFLEEYLETTLANHRQEKSSLALLFVDLDRFKNINDSLGHSVGDLFLKSFSQEIKQSLPKGNFVCRYGGDEFIIILNHTDRLATEAFARKLLTSLNTPITIMDHSLYTTMSIGISLYPDDGESLPVLLKKADQAMYMVKKQGKNNFLFYISDLGQQYNRKAIIEKELRKELERGNLNVVYQPQYQLSTGKLTGVEALVRWQHLDYGFISPAEFIPIAEETGMINEIGRFVLREACRQNVIWNNMGITDLKVAVNVSTFQFRDRDFINDVKSILHETKLGADLLELEITESALHDIEESKYILNRLREFGVKVSVDDFGTGYSSLNVLKHLSVDYLKIDKSFIDGINMDLRSRAIIKTIVDMGHHLNFELIAEGIEDQVQLSFLKEINCEYGQGYYFGHPLAGQEFEELLLNRRIYTYSS